MNNKQLTPPAIIILASGAVQLIGLFLPWFSNGSDENGFGSFVFPLGTIALLCGIAMAVVIALKNFAGTNLPEKVWLFNWNQIHLILAVYSALVMVGYLLLDVGGADKGIGLWLSLLAAIGLVVGAVMLGQEEGSGAAAPGAAPPTPF